MKIKKTILPMGGGGPFAPAPPPIKTTNNFMHWKSQNSVSTLGCHPCLKIKKTILPVGALSVPPITQRCGSALGLLTTPF